jgi:hypothetical protein
MANPKYPKFPIQRQSIEVFRARLDKLRKNALESDVLQLTPKELEEVRSSSELITPNSGVLVPESEQNLAYESLTSLHEALLGDVDRSELSLFKTKVDNEK